MTSINKLVRNKLKQDAVAQCFLHSFPCEIVAHDTNLVAVILGLQQSTKLTPTYPQEAHLPEKGTGKQLSKQCVLIQIKSAGEMLPSMTTE